MLVQDDAARCNVRMVTLYLLRTAARRSLKRPVSPVGVMLVLAFVHMAVLALAAWGALALAETPGIPEAASPQAPPSVIAPPRPAPGDGQGPMLRDRLVRQAFAQADRDHDGQLSPEEAASLPGLPERFDKVDANRDGRISLEEFRAAGGP